MIVSSLSHIKLKKGKRSERYDTRNGPGHGEERLRHLSSWLSVKDLVRGVGASDTEVGDEDVCRHLLQS